MSYELNYEALEATFQEVTQFVITPARLTIKEEKLGDGGFGEVCLAILDESSNYPTKVAVKELRIPLASRQRIAFRLARELTIWAKVNHPNILELIGYHLSPDYGGARLVSAFMVNGNVMQYIQQRTVSVAVRLKFVRNIATGLKYLHNYSPPICHADLKPANVLVNETIDAVLCDFGLSSFIHESGAASGLTTSKSIKGSTRYMSPELLLEEQCNHTLSSDVWAWGCTAFEIMTGSIPYSSKSKDSAIIMEILQKSVPGSIEALDNVVVSAAVDPACYTGVSSLRPIILQCWDFDPEGRPSSSILLQSIVPPVNIEAVWGARKNARNGPEVVPVHQKGDRQLSYPLRSRADNSLRYDFDDELPSGVLPPPLLSSQRGLLYTPAPPPSATKQGAWGDPQSTPLPPSPAPTPALRSEPTYLSAAEEKARLAAQYATDPPTALNPPQPRRSNTTHVAQAPKAAPAGDSFYDEDGSPNLPPSYGFGTPEGHMQQGMYQTNLASLGPGAYMPPLPPRPSQRGLPHMPAPPPSATKQGAWADPQSTPLPPLPAPTPALRSEPTYLSAAEEKARLAAQYEADRPTASTPPQPRRSNTTQVVQAPKAAPAGDSFYDGDSLPNLPPSYAGFGTANPSLTPFLIPQVPPLPSLSSQRGRLHTPTSSPSATEQGAWEDPQRTPLPPSPAPTPASKSKPTYLSAAEEKARLAAQYEADRPTASTPPKPRRSNTNQVFQSPTTAPAGNPFYDEDGSPNLSQSYGFGTAGGQMPQGMYQTNLASPGPGYFSTPAPDPASETPPALMRPETKASPPNSRSSPPQGNSRVADFALDTRMDKGYRTHRPAPTYETNRGNHEQTTGERRQPPHPRTVLKEDSLGADGDDNSRSIGTAVRRFFKGLSRLTD